MLPPSIHIIYSCYLFILSIHIGLYSWARNSIYYSLTQIRIIYSINSCIQKLQFAHPKNYNLPMLFVNAVIFFISVVTFRWCPYMRVLIYAALHAVFILLMLFMLRFMLHFISLLCGALCFIVCESVQGTNIRRQNLEKRGGNGVATAVRLEFDAFLLQNRARCTHSSAKSVAALK